MGIMDFVKSGVGELMIQRPDEKKDLIIYKHPEMTIPFGAQITVDADETTLFFKDGAIAGKLNTVGVGKRHTLSSQNIPFLGSLIDKFTGGNVFVTDLYFVTLRPLYDLRFGGELGYMEDPLLGEMVTPRIYGTYALQIQDPEKFLLNYVGLKNPDGNESVTGWMTGKFMNHVKSVIGEICVTERKSFLELMPFQNQIGQTLEARCPDLQDIGVKIIQVGEFQLNLSPEDEKRLKEAQGEIGKAKRAARVAQIGVGEAQARTQQKQFELDQELSQDSKYVQNLTGGNFAQYAAGKAMLGAGEGMSESGGGSGGEGGSSTSGGNAVMAGAGLGAGLGMAHAFVDGLRPQTLGQPESGSSGQNSSPNSTDNATLISCPSCKVHVHTGKFCSECGTTLQPQKTVCEQCNTENAPGSKFCSECGQKVEK